jgi:DNA ligase-1
MQILSTRGRKDVKVEDIKVQVCVFAFDCLYLNGETLLQLPLTKRRAALQTAVKEEHGRMQIATAKVGPCACGARSYRTSGM